MNINAFQIDAITKTVTINASEPDGPWVGIGNLKLHGHESKTVRELEAYARSEARRLL